MKRVLLVLLTVVLSTTGMAPASAASKTRLTIKADLFDGAGMRKWSLICDTKGGNHPNRTEACALLKAKGRTIFTPVPKNAMCTMIYGGDQKITVTGVVANRKVSATFTRANGCEIARYEKAIALFTIPNTQVFFGSVLLNETPTNAPVVFTDRKTTVGTRANESGFRIRLGIGTWTGSAAGAGFSCQPVTITVPAPDAPLTISCTAIKS